MPRKAKPAPPSAGIKAQDPPVRLRGGNLKQFGSAVDIGLVEVGTAFGLNTTRLYSIVNKDEPLKAPLAILLRIYEAFPEMLPRITTPTVDEFVALIQRAQPTFKEYSVGPLLGLDKNSFYRIREKGFEESKDATKIIVILIWKLLNENIGNWPVLKSLIEAEAASRGQDPEKIWTSGRWTTTKTVEDEKPADSDDVSQPAGTVVKRKRQMETKKITWAN